MAGNTFHHVAFGFGLLFAASGLDAAATAQSAPLETQVKAAFLPKFAAYVSWPPGAFRAPDDPVLLCIIGQDPFGRNIDESAARQQVDLHPIQVRRLETTTAADHCNIAFLGGSAKQSAAAMEEALLGQPILTVTDANLGAGRGIVHFELQGGRVRFHIDDALAARSNLTISARLLGLAISVKPRARAS
jgi:hypothetical protein